MSHTRCLDLDWAADLVSVDPVRRASALSRHYETEERHAVALRRVNEIWQQAGTLCPAELHLAAALEQAIAETRESHRHLFLGAVCDWYDHCEDSDRYLPYALLFLEWEAYFPEDWPAMWETKRKVLRRFAREPRLTRDVRERLLDLVDSAIRREHRCEDAGYAAVARAIDGAQLRLRVAQARRAQDPLFRVRADFIHHLLVNPQVSARPTSWHRWLRSEP